MDEKTEHLRDIFVETTGEETVTDSQEDQRGTLLDGPDSEDVCAVVTAMRERFDFETALSDDALCRLVRAFYEGHTDADIAAVLGVSADAVFEARMDLLLVRETDTDDIDHEALAEHLDSDDSPESAAAALDIPVEDARRGARVHTARERARRTSYRYQIAFEERLTDTDLSVRLTAAAREDGLREAAEDIETNLEF